jgi:hypothetical protein
MQATIDDGMESHPAPLLACMKVPSLSWRYTQNITGPLVPMTRHWSQSHGQRKR